MPARKHRLTQSHKLCGRNHENFKQLRRTTKDTIGLQFDPVGDVTNLSTKTLLKLLHKNPNLAPTQKYFNKNKPFNERNGFYRRIKIEANFIHEKKKLKTEKDIFTK